MINTLQQRRPQAGVEDLKDREDLSLFRNQVRTFKTNLMTKYAYLNATKNTDFASAVLTKAERVFGKKEIKENVSEFDTDLLRSPSSGTTGELECIARTQELIDSMTTLLSFLDYHLGDPVAMELLSDTLDQARVVLKQNMTVCSVLLCRITLEQSLRRLCERNNIEFEPNEKASSLKDKLGKADVLQAHESKELEARLIYTNKVVHKDIEASREDVVELIEWTDRFTSHFLEGHSR